MSASLLSACLLPALLAGAEPEPPTIAVEMRFLSLSGDCYHRLTDGLGVREQAAAAEEAADCRFLTGLSDRETFLFLEAVQGDAAASVLSAPKINAFDNQTAQVMIGQEMPFITGVELAWREKKLVAVRRLEYVPVGMKVALTPRASADGRYVRVHLDASCTDLAQSPPVRAHVRLSSPAVVEGADETTDEYTIDQPTVVRLDVDRTFVVPDGKTAVLGGWKRKTSRDSTGALSKLPILGELFDPQAKAEQEEHVLILVTPHLQPVQTAEEDALPAPREAPVQESAPKVQSCPDYRTPIIDPVPPERASRPEEDSCPTDAEVLRALPRPTSVPLVCEESRDDVTIVRERVGHHVQVIDGVATHRACWKCTVFFTQTVESQYPFPFRRTAPKVEVVYLDQQYLTPVASSQR
jgi:hypothetical protein